ncbi:MAG TPA: M1 family metallopeptidase, partial [Candidatus Nitrosocosmicus sp.]|nr:M1 family metallopeptidase [Candidatus Nitrosocosmicus sp.]
MKGNNKTNVIINVNNTDLIRHRFEFPGSRFHEIPSFPYRIEQMSLKIFPDFQRMILTDCYQNLRISFLRNTKNIELDITELKILNVTSSNINISEFSIKNNKRLMINFAETAQEGTAADISIYYSAGYYKRNYDDSDMHLRAPRNGFHFIVDKNLDDKLEEEEEEEEKAYQAWTQGETTEAKYWFPCIDSPHAKFSLDIEITAPAQYDVISNGRLISKVFNDKDELLTWKYIETNPLPAYLVSVVIGKFSKIEINHHSVPLIYYWPEDIHEDNAMLTFSETPKMIDFFESYFATKYPFQKYSQVAVDNFEFGGMENLSCTTFTRRVLHDKKTSLDYKNDLLLIVHELAHQWFGNLVTCRGWPHIWLNEGFATYCESLYLENSKGIDEFQYSLIEATDIYFEEANEHYIRPIVTNLYKHPDELFDAHSYEKAGFILHMLRSFLGEADFKKSIKEYIIRYQNSTATSNDLLQTIEEVTGVQVQTFFDQWIYRKGHPKIEIEYTLTLANNHRGKTNEQVNKLKIKVIQLQTHSVDQSFLPPYQFELEIKIVIEDILGKRKEILHLMQISQWDSESVVKFDREYSISYVSIDPQFKILKVIKSVKIQGESKEFHLRKILLTQLKTGDTVIEKIQAIRSMKDFFNDDIISSLRDTILDDNFFGVGKEAANTIGSYHDINNYEKSDKAYQTLLTTFRHNEKFLKLNNHVKRAILKSIGIFERIESIDILESILKDPAIESDFIKSVAATALGKSAKKASDLDKKRIMLLLKEIINTSNSFQSVVATGALDGLSELSHDKNHDDDNNEEIYLEVANFLLQNTSITKDYFIRAKSARLLGKFLANKFAATNSDIIDMN